MSHTAFSRQFDQELDFKQLLKRRGVTATLEQSDYGLTQAERDWMRADLLCPSCRCSGASLVRSDGPATTGRNTRQPHFRFIDASGHTAHKIGCDFYALDDMPGIQRGVDVRYSANDKDTRVIRDLVCRAFAVGELQKPQIFDMRTWFLACRDRHTFDVRGAPAMVDWLSHVWSLPTYEALAFEPFHIGLPGFDARRAARRHLAFVHRQLHDRIPRGPFDAAVRHRTKQLLAAHKGGQLIAMNALRAEYEAAVLLAGLMDDLGDLPLTKHRTAGVWAKVPEALLAFSATLLFVSGWNTDAALSRFARILQAPPAQDDTLANVMGLNPFHDFLALERARFISELPASEEALDYEAEMAAIMARIHSASPTAPGVS